MIINIRIIITILHSQKGCTTTTGKINIFPLQLLKNQDKNTTVLIFKTINKVVVFNCT